MEINRIYCADNVDFMKENIPSNFIDLTVTSPPYDNLRAYNGILGTLKGLQKSYTG